MQQICPKNSVVVINNLPRRKRHAAQEGGVLLYFHAHVGSGHFRGSKISISVSFGVFREMNVFGGMKILEILCIFWGFITYLDYI